MTLDIDGIPCPFCNKAHVETFDADLPDVTSFGVVGGLQWRCPSCGRSGTLEYTAYFGHAAFFDDRGDKIGEVD